MWMNGNNDRIKREKEMFVKKTHCILVNALTIAFLLPTYIDMFPKLKNDCDATTIIKTMDKKLFQHWRMQ